jgi:hypothetical protein
MKRSLLALVAANLVLSLTALGAVAWVAQRPQRTKVVVKAGPHGLVGVRGPTGARGRRGPPGHPSLSLPPPPSFDQTREWKDLKYQVDAICTAGLVGGYDQALGGSTLHFWYCPPTAE